MIARTLAVLSLSLLAGLTTAGSASGKKPAPSAPTMAEKIYHRDVFGAPRGELEDPYGLVNIVASEVWSGIGAPLRSRGAATVPALGVMGREIQRAVAEDFFGVWEEIGRASDKDRGSACVHPALTEGKIVRGKGDSVAGSLSVSKPWSRPMTTRGTVERADGYRCHVSIDTLGGSVEILREGPQGTPLLALYGQTLPTLGAKQAWGAVTCTVKAANRGKDQYVLRLGPTARFAIRLPGAAGQLVYKALAWLGDRRAASARTKADR